MKKELADGITVFSEGMCDSKRYLSESYTAGLNVEPLRGCQLDLAQRQGLTKFNTYSLVLVFSQCAPLRTDNTASGKGE